MHQTFTAPLSIVATDPMPTLDFADAERLRAVARRAEAVLPGAVGQYLRRELESWAEIGLRFDQQGLTERTVTAILAMPLPDPPAAAQRAA
uniref:hypothetical protein n=1 Tax=Pseudonocardia sp. CA-138482 TaxID=3240023 RepID=UPI003F495B7F